MTPLICAAMYFGDRERTETSGVFAALGDAGEADGGHDDAAARLAVVASRATAWARPSRCRVRRPDLRCSVAVRLARLHVLGVHGYGRLPRCQSGSWGVAANRGLATTGIFLGRELGRAAAGDRSGAALARGHRLVALADRRLHRRRRRLQVLRSLLLAARAAVRRRSPRARLRRANRKGLDHHRRRSSAASVVVFVTLGLDRASRPAAPVRPDRGRHRRTNRSERSHLRVGSVPAGVLGVRPATGDEVLDCRLPDRLERRPLVVRASACSTRSTARGTTSQGSRCPSPGVDRRYVTRDGVFGRSVPRLRRVLACQLPASRRSRRGSLVRRRRRPSDRRRSHSPGEGRHVERAPRPTSARVRFESTTGRGSRRPRCRRARSAGGRTSRHPIVVR